MSCSAIALLIFALPARATILQNGSFSDVGTATVSFSISNPTLLPNWTATPSGNQILDCLIFAGATTNLCPTSFGGSFQFWVNPGPSPDGGNYVAVDGDQNYSTALQQTLAGLVVGKQYSLSYYQAAAQQSGFTGATTERWQVSLGSDTQLSTLLNNASHGSVPWAKQTMTFTASATSEVLSFLAVGTPNGEPPFVLLDGVTFDVATPEPGTATLLGLGFGLLSIPFVRRLRKERS